MALSSGNPDEWNAMRHSTTGHASTGSSRICCSSKTTMRKKSCGRRLKISRMGLDDVFLAIAQTPSTTVRLLRILSSASFVLSLSDRDRSVAFLISASGAGSNAPSAENPDVWRGCMASAPTSRGPTRRLQRG